MSHRRSQAHASAPARSDAPRVNALVMDLLRERDDLRAAVAAKDTALAAKETALTAKDTALAAKDTALSQRDLAYGELAIETHTLRQELDTERRERTRLQEAIDESSRQSTQQSIKAAEYEQLKRRLYDLLDDAIPRGATVLMVSRGDDALLHLNGRHVSHFPRTREGAWNGHPADSQDAIDQLETIRKTGGAYLVLPATAVWWLQHYGHLRTYLEQRCRLVVNQEAIALVFELL